MTANLPDIARHTLVGIHPTRTPAVPSDRTLPVLHRQLNLGSVPRDQWDNEYLLDVCAVFQFDAYDLCDSTDHMEAICALAIGRDAAARLAEENLAECLRQLQVERKQHATAMRGMRLERAIAGAAYCDLAAQAEQRERSVVDDMEDTHVVDVN
jgi:hypothetical protein